MPHTIFYKKYINVFLIIYFLAIILGCKNPNSNSHSIHNSKADNHPDFIIVGWHETDKKRMAVIWRNGVEEILPNPLGLEEYSSMAQGITVHDGNIYIVGNLNFNGEIINIIWKNGLPSVISDGEQPAYARKIAVLDNNIYLIGITGQNQAATLWHNGKAIVISDSKYKSNTRSIITKDSKILVGGMDNGLATIWTITTDRIEKAVLSTKESAINSIFYYDNDIYSSGDIISQYGTTSAVWKNNYTSFSAKHEQATCSTSIYVGHQKIIVGGSKYENQVQKAMVLINGVEQKIYGLGDCSSEISEVAMSGDTVISIGNIGDFPNTVAFFCKNGQCEMLSSKKYPSRANAMIIIYRN